MGAAFKITPGPTEQLFEESAVQGAKAALSGDDAMGRPVVCGKEALLGAEEKRAHFPGVWTRRTFVGRVARTGRIEHSGHLPLVHPRELMFSEETIKQFDGALVTLGHVHRRVIGRTMFPRIEAGRFIVCDVIIDVPRALRIIDLGWRELSTWAEREYTVRTIDGERMHVAHTYALKHIALVKRGAHVDTRLLLDDEARELRAREAAEDDEVLHG